MPLSRGFGIGVRKHDCIKVDSVFNPFGVMAIIIINGVQWFAIGIDSRVR